MASDGAMGPQVMATKMGCKQRSQRQEVRFQGLPTTEAYSGVASLIGLTSAVAFERCAVYALPTGPR
jgi:hypothetical protein